MKRRLSILSFWFDIAVTLFLAVYIVIALPSYSHFGSLDYGLFLIYLLNVLRKAEDINRRTTAPQRQKEKYQS